MVFLPSYKNQESFSSPQKHHEKTTQIFTNQTMCTPVCAALGYGPQAEFDEQVARKDAEVRLRRLLPRDGAALRFFVFVLAFVFFFFQSRSSSPAERLKDLEQKRVFSNSKRLMRDALRVE